MNEYERKQEARRERYLELADKAELGIHEFLEKPFTVMNLADTLAGLVELQNPRTA